MDQPPLTPSERRFARQIERVEEILPWLQRYRGPEWRLRRFLIALLLICGSVLWILPVFGLWMLPLALMVLAIDIPILRGPMAALFIRARRFWMRLKARFSFR